MIEHDVRRLVYASSNHAVGRTPRTDLLTTAARPRPDTFYGVGKVAAEAVMSLYADRYGLDAVACRIGSFLPEPETVAAPEHVALPRRLRAHGRGVPDDSGARASRSSTASPPTPAGGGTSTPAVLSATTRRTTRRSSPTASPAREADDAEAAHVGGPFATEEFYRSALDRA